MSNDSYQVKIDKIKEEILQAKSSLINLNEQLEVFENLHDDSIKPILSKNIILTLAKLVEDIEKENLSLINLMAVLRFVFESLIVTNLIINEKNYDKRIFYSIFLQQSNKIEKMIIKLEKEIELLEQFEKRENEIFSQVPNDVSNKEEVSKFIEEQKQTANQLYEELNNHFTIFMTGVEHNGMGFHKALLQKQLLPKYKEIENEIKTETSNITKILSKDDELNTQFDIRRQASRVLKKLKDDRGWFSKASEIGLEDEYNFVYELTSSLMHFTSYAVTTPSELQEEEKLMCYNLINKYLNKISNNLYKYNNIPPSLRINVIRIDDESKN